MNIGSHGAVGGGERALERLQRIAADYRAELPADQSLDAGALYDREGLCR